MNFAENQKELTLIGIEACPYVQRSWILLELKKMDYDFVKVDLQNKPDWFLKISPAAKVPLLVVNGKVIFESLVINDFIDENYGKQLLDLAPVDKAINRSWAEFSSSFFMNTHQLINSADTSSMGDVIDKIKHHLSFVQANISAPFFNGSKMALTDVAFAPFFIRCEIMADYFNFDLLEDHVKVKSWSNNVLDVIRNFEVMDKETIDMLVNRIRSNSALFKEELA